MDQLLSLLPLVALALVFWLIIVRPASRQRKEVARIQGNLEVGDRVMLSSGIFATLRAVEGDRVSAEVADGVVIQVARGAVAGLDTPAVQPELTDAEEDSSDTPEKGA